MPTAVHAGTGEAPVVGRRTILTLGTLAALAVGATACGTSGPVAGPAREAFGSASGSATMWSLTSEPNKTIVGNSLTAFNKLGMGTLDLTTYQNDAYKIKIRTALGAGQAPTLIFGWGGGVLKSYVAAEQVDDLTAFVDETPGYKDKFNDNVWPSATVGGRIYGVPINSTQPIIMYYNTKLFADHGAEPPKTWADVMHLVDLFNGKGVAPFSLGGQSRWTSMMWVEYLLDRIGGPEVFAAIFADAADAWSDEAVVETCTRIQDLVRAEGFIKGFSSITADGKADQALLFTNRAAMMLHGSWAYANMKHINAEFVADSLDYGGFPRVQGGKGDPSNIVGAPANYLSISASATEEEKAVAKAYLIDGLYSDADIEAYVAAGGMPVVKSAEKRIGSSPDARYLQFVYDLVSEAPNFELSWDQALSPAQSEALLTNIDRLFLLTVTPEQFASNMNATLDK